MTNRTNLRSVVVAALLLVVLVSANAGADPNSLWKLDEGSGTTASDSIGTNHGTLINDPNWGPGVDGNCVEFDGVNDYVEVPNDVSLNFAAGEDFTIGMWFRIDRPTHTIAQEILNKRESGGEQLGWHIYYESDSSMFHYRKIRIEMDNGPSRSKVGSNTFVNDGQWHHLVLVRQSSNYGVYLDAVFQMAYDLSGYDAAWVNSAPLRFGTDESLTGFLEGAMDEVAIYNTALSPVEIDQLYHDGFKKAHTPNPENEIIEIALSTDLGWTPYSAATSQEVFFGTVSGSLSSVASGDGDMNSVSNAQIGGPLDYSQTYYWRIDTDSRTGDEWHFTTYRPKATVPSPSDDQYAVDISTNLGWTPDAVATSQEVYFGTVSGSLSLVASGDGTLNSASNAQIGGPLDYSETYYWRVDTDGFTGVEWSFDTSRLAGAIYVDANRPLGGDGTSWADAYKYLQDALDATYSATKPVEIHVAQGIYKPDQDEGGDVTGGDRTATFQLINDVIIKGGYAGFDEADPNEQDIIVNETVLSGDLDGNDVQVANPSDLLTDPNRVENSYHVVTGSGTNSTAVLDGFTITGGNANGSSPYNRGGGIYSSGSTATISNCTLTANSASNSGGGRYSNGSSTLTNCRFIGNASSSGGGGMTSSSGDELTLIDCAFIDNYAGSGGGGMYISINDNDVKLTNCIFIGNIAVNNGGALNILAMNQADLKYTNCVFSGNQAGGNGGAYSTSHDLGEFANCTFSENSAGGNGGAMYIYNNGEVVTLTNCVLWGNTASGEGPQIAVDTDTCTFSIDYSDVQGGEWDVYDPYGIVNWGVNNIDSDPLFADANGADDTLGTEDDNLRLLTGSPCIDAGDNSAVPVDVNEDLDDRARIIDGDCNDTDIVDMGAYEFGWLYLGDFAGGCDVDFVDFAVLGLTWLKADGEIGYDPNCDISLPADDFVDEKDLEIFTGNWLSKQ